MTVTSAVCEGFWSCLYAYQTLVVGAVGFLGVVFTLWQNARLGRLQRVEERDHEREALRAALIEELEIVRHALAENAQETEKRRTAATVLVPTVAMDEVYQAFVPRIGLLSREEVQKVMRAHLTLRTYNAKLFIIGKPMEASARNIEVPQKHVSLLSGMQKALLEPIDEALGAMKAALACK